MPTLRYLAFLIKRFERASILFVTQEDHARLRADAMAAGIPREQMVLARAEFVNMPVYLRLMDIGVFFIKPSFSKQASAATKLAEFLATGVPIIINDGVGDSGDIIREHRVGIVLPTVTEEVFGLSVTQLKDLLNDPSLGVRCRQVAQRYFDLETGVMKYLDLYRRLYGDRYSVSKTTRSRVADTIRPDAPLEPVLSVNATS
jgi:glycosyltransferase involved in cell wall biosynthesis